VCFLRSTDETKEEGMAWRKSVVFTFMETYASAQNVVLMGTGPGETYVGDEAIRGAYVQFFKRHEANTLNFKYDWISVGSKGDVAWFAATINVNVEDMVTNQKRERAFNMSGTMEKVKGKWMFVSMHFSNCDQPSVCILPSP